MSATAESATLTERRAVFTVTLLRPLQLLIASSVCLVLRDCVSQLDRYHALPPGPDFWIHAHRAWQAAPDLWVEAFSRIAMCFLAIFLASSVQRTGQEQFRASLLAWALVGLSLDLPWQMTRLEYAGVWQWAAMVAKYAGISGGLSALLALTACFRARECSGASRLLQMAAPWAGLVMFGLGVFHGQSYIVNGNSSCDPHSLCESTYFAYLAWDILMRVAIIAAVVLGYVQAPEPEKQRQRLIAISCMFFALGTILNFGSRFIGDIWGNAPSIVDAVTTLMFPAGLVIAASRRELFSIDWVIDRALLFAVVVTVFTAVFGIFHDLIVTFLEHGESESSTAKFVSLVLAGVVAIGLKPLEEKAHEKLVKAVLPDRAARLRRLEEFGERIVLINDRSTLDEFATRTIASATAATFVAGYTRESSGSFELSIRPKHGRISVPTAIAESGATSAEFGELRRGHDLRKARAASVVPGAALVLPMILAGRLVGFFALGPRNHEVPSYDHDEIRALSAAVRETGAALFALNPPRTAS